MRHHSHWIVLLVGIVISCALWLWWLFGGMVFAHSTIAERAVPIQAPTARPNMPLSAGSPVLAPVAPNGERDTAFTELGQTGDSFGGLNALLTAIAGALVFWAGFMQHQTLKQMREEAKSERSHRNIQEFESLFFRLLELTAVAVERIEGPKRMGSSDKPHLRHKGARALDSLARSLYDQVGSHFGNQADTGSQLEALVDGYLTQIYDRQPSAFGPYLRLLYQTFKHVAESTLTEEQQVRYANIARGQISEGAVLLLAANGLAPNGYDFVPLIEKFGLLEHMHRRYRKEYGRALSLCYRPRAFLGSSERSVSGNEWQPTPLFSKDHFKYLETRRSVADEEAEFEAGFHDEPPPD